MRRTLKKVKEQESKILYIIGVIAAIILIVSVVSLMDSDSSNVFNKIESKYEITKTDIFAAKDFVGEEVSVKGVIIGDTFDEVIEKIGYPDSQTEFPPDIRNLEYGKKFDLEGTALIIHLKNNVVDRITIKPLFNDFLVGKTKIDYTKAQMYNLFGKPDNIEFLRISPGSVLLYRLYSYDEYGLEVTVRKNVMNGFSLTRGKKSIE